MPGFLRNESSLKARGGFEAVNFSRVQHRDSGHWNSNVVSIWLDSTPVVGNLLVACAFHRSEMATAPSISGSGWSQRIWRATGMGANNDRRGLVISTKVAGSSEPTFIEYEWISGGISARMTVQEFSADKAFAWQFLAAGSGDSGTGATGSGSHQMNGTTDSPVGPFAVGNASPGGQSLFRFGYLAGRCYDTAVPGASFAAADGTVLEAAGQSFQTSWATAFKRDDTGGSTLNETAAWTNAQLQTSVGALIFGGAGAS